LTGGIALALDIGHEFRLRMGDREQWNRKNDDHSMEAVPRMLLDLQDRLGYEFRSPRLLVEALTHASFPSAVTSELGEPRSL
jgi:endoribonuclease Dicer